MATKILDLKERGNRLRYWRRKLPTGTALNLISVDQGLPETIAISLVSGLGANLAAAGEAGEERIAFPPGTAHFLEHLMFWTGFEEHALAIANEHICDPNAFVTYSGTVWFAAEALVDFAQLESRSRGDVGPRNHKMWINSAAAVCGHLLALNILRPEQLADLRPDLLDWMRNDVVNEIHFRRSNLSYRMQMALFQGLFPSLPEGNDILGSISSLSEIRIEQVQAAAGHARRSLLAVNIAGCQIDPDLAESLLDRIEEMLADLPAGCGISPASDRQDLPRPVRDPILVATTRESDHADVLVGFRLPPIDRVHCAAAREEAFLAWYLAKNFMRLPLSSIASRSWRVFMALSSHPDAWRLLDPAECRLIVARHQESLAEQVESVIPHALKWLAWIRGELTTKSNLPFKLLNWMELLEIDPWIALPKLWRFPPLALQDLTEELRACRHSAMVAACRDAEELGVFLAG